MWSVEIAPGILAGRIAPFLASNATDRVVPAVLHDTDTDNPSWSHLDEQERDMRRSATETMTRMYSVSRTCVAVMFREEWTHLDALCAEKTGLDARTLLKALDHTGTLATVLDSVLRENPKDTSVDADSAE